MIRNPAKTYSLSVTAGAFLSFGIALLLFSINLGRAPHPDELHHALAAQHLFETGRPQIWEGEYWRVFQHTWMVAVSYELFGEGIAAARMPAVLFAALVAPILFVWLRREAGVLAAGIGTAIYVTSPFTIEIAQFSRFYALQLFSFVSGLALYYYALDTSRPLRFRALFLVGSIALFSSAISAQVTTIVGLVGVSVWTIGLFLIYLLNLRNPSRTGRYVIVAGVLLLLIVIAIFGMNLEFVQWAWQRHQTVPLFNIALKDEFWFYYVRYLAFYPTLWTLIGVLALSAIIRGHRVAWLAICVFSLSFVIMSLAGSKNTRYLSFAQPFLAMIWGLGLAELWSIIQRYLKESSGRLTGVLSMPGRSGSIAGHAVVFGAISILILANPFWIRTVALIGSIDTPLEDPTVDWRAADADLRPWVESAEIMISTEELGALYFLGRADIIYNPSKQRELAKDQRIEFGIDHRTGLPVIAEPESLELLINCYRSGFVVGPTKTWGESIRFNEAAQEVIVRNAEGIDVPPNSHLFAWGWNNAGAERSADQCAGISQFSGLD